MKHTFFFKSLNFIVLVSTLTLSNQAALYAVPDQGAYSPDSLFFSDVPVVLSATRLTQPIQKTPGPVSVIDRKMIDASGAVNLADLMRLVPGFQVTHALGHRHTVTSHGMSSDWSKRLLVMIDNRSVYTSLLSTTDWASLAVELDDIERIEVFRGPNAPSYGANAFIGVVNIITKRSFQDEGFFIKTEVGDIDHRYGMLRYADAEGDLSQRFSVSYREDSGFPVVPGFAGGHDDAEIAKLSYRSEYNLSSKDNLEFQLGYSNSELEVGLSNDLLDPVRDTGIITNHQLVSWERTLSSTDSFKLQLSHNYTNKTDGFNVDLATLFGVPAAAIPGITGHPDLSIYFSLIDAKSERYDLEAQHIMQLAPDMRMVWGGNLRQDEMSSMRWIGSNTPITDVSQRLFSNLEWNLSDMTQLNAGVMFEKHENHDLATSWRLAANHQLSSNHTIRASATHGVRTLSLLERNTYFAAYYADGATFDILSVTTNTDPEENDTFEIGYFFQSPQNNISVDVSLFKTELTSLRTDYDDQSYVDPFELANGREYNSSNDSHANIEGLEVQLRWEPSTADLISLQYAYSQIEGRYLRGYIPANTPPESYIILDDEAPKHTASLLASHTFDNDWSLSGVIYYMSEMEWLGNGEPMPDYTRADLRVAKEFKVSNNDAKLELVAQNIGPSYHEFITVQNPTDTDVNVFETRAYLKFSVQF